MLRHFAPLAAAAAVAASASAETRTVDVGSFNAVDAVNGVDVEVSYGSPASVALDGPASQIDDVEVEVDGEVLRVQPRNRGWWRGRFDVDDTVVRITAPSLDQVRARNGAHVALPAVPADARVELTASNGAMLEADGVCDAMVAEASRGGQLDASELDCRVVVAVASMGGLAAVMARESLVATASMGGAVAYGGQVEDVRSSSSMGGMVYRDD